MSSALLDDMRHGRVPDPGALTVFVDGLADGVTSDAEAGAFAMAVCLQGLGTEGRATLTRAMTESGAVLAWDLPGPVVDKHSTGGVGDCVSLVLAPALIALGCYVPMISGRGLGHTGGTLDKLEAIPGLVVEQPTDRFRQIVAEVGGAIVAANADIAPADRRLYAVRDQTATVDQIDLITASILSKKLAAGLGALVLDVKVGQGAFMTDLPAATALARALVDTSNAAGCPCTALISDMNQPVAPAIGNAVELAEVVRVLTSGAPARLVDLSAALGGEVLALAGQAPDIATGTARIREVIASGKAAEAFARMIAAQGGPVDFVERPEAHLRAAPVRHVVTMRAEGVLGGIDGTALGHAVIALGGGRTNAGARIDHAVGITGLPDLGTALAPGDPLATIHAADDASATVAEAALIAALSFGEAAPPPLIHTRVSP